VRLKLILQKLIFKVISEGAIQQEVMLKKLTLQKSIFKAISGGVIQQEAMLKKLALQKLIFKVISGGATKQKVMLKKLILSRLFLRRDFLVLKKVCLRKVMRKSKPTGKDSTYFAGKIMQVVMNNTLTQCRYY